MADPSPEKKGGIKDIIGKNFYATFSNLIKRTPPFSLFNFGERSWESKTGELRESPLSRRELRVLRTLNASLIEGLKALEEKWLIIEALIWGEKEHETVKYNLIHPPESGKENEGLIGQVLFYRDPEIVKLETRLFSNNRKFSKEGLPAKYGGNFAALIDALKTEIKAAHGNNPAFNSAVDNFFSSLPAEDRNVIESTSFYKLEGEKVNLFPELGKSGASWIGEENIYPLGWQNWEQVLEDTAGYFQQLLNKMEQEAAGASAAVQAIPRLLTEQNQTLGKVLHEVYKGSDNDEGGEYSHYSFVNKLESPLADIISLRDRLLEFQPEHVRFKHTFKVIKPFIYVQSGNTRRMVMFEDATEALHPKWNQTPWEINAGVPPGFDEYGNQLEINDEGEVLLDKWWHEISKNSWQKKIIKEKPGGDEILQKIQHFSNANDCRKVNQRWTDPKFGDPYLDIVDMSVYIHVQYDSYRDDFRDGRHHKWSKGAIDYCIAAEGGFSVAPYLRLSHGIRGVIPTTDSGTPTFDAKNPHDYINAKPEDFFAGITDEEKAVVRNYKMKLTDGPNGTGGTVLGEPDHYKFTNVLMASMTEEEKLGREYGTLIRKNSHASPAFDRRALKRKGPFIHWGRMHYYEWQDKGINRWSDNPFPYIGSRGMAQYVLDRVIRGLYSFKDQRRTITDFGIKGYDYGVRRPLVGGTRARFPVDLLGGTDVVQDGEW